MSTSDDVTFKQEQDHLHETYQTLCTMENAVTKRMAQTAAAAGADKRSMADEIASNFASEGEAQETYIEYASVNSVIESYNQMQATDAEKMSRIQILKQQPYFAKVVLQYKEGDAPKELYLGNVGISDENYRRLVVDWRSPIAEVYYNQSNGPTSYVANGRTISVDLKLRRQFDVEQDHLKSYFDTTVAIQDELLLASLTRKRSAHMQAITATIQKEQNTVVRHEDVPVLLVNGIAGSGKTSVLLQRIAYLFYQNREDLNPEQVFLVTPNPVFRSYINNVLPDMGERNPHIVTWQEFFQGFIPSGRTFDEEHTSPEILENIDKAVQDLSFDQRDFKDISCAGTKLISANQIASLSKKYHRFPAGPRRITMMREALEERLESRLAQMAASEDIQNLLADLTPNEHLRLFHEPYNPQTPEEARDFALRYLHQTYEDAFMIIRNDHWLRIDRIARRLLGIETLTGFEWLYLKMACTGLSNPDARYVMIDEVQDYSSAQLMILARYFRRAHFLLLGDENQAITSHTASFATASDIFSKAFGSVETCHLMTSYRSSPAITSLFASLLNSDEQMRVSSVQRDDIAPVFITCTDKEDRNERLRALIDAAQQSEGLTAIITINDDEARKLYEDLCNQHEQANVIPHSQDNPGTMLENLSSDITLITEQAALPESGTVILSLPLAKGLEFDHVIIPEINEKAFPHDEISRRRLYTTISRATNTITLLSTGSITPFLAQHPLAR